MLYVDYIILTDDASPFLRMQLVSATSRELESNKESGRCAAEKSKMGMN